ncbi:MAG: NosD domain-containing protein [Candidatus Heimdallarchaeaceae archaeon]
MKRNRDLMIVLLVVLSTTLIESDILGNLKDQNSSSTPFFHFFNHNSISIENDTAFITYGFPGSGSEINPYSIENYNITTSSEIAINIINTTKYFIIKNCFINAEKYGMLIKNVSPGTAIIINNTCNGHEKIGIRIEETDKITVINNICNENGHIGINIGDSIQSTIEGNHCENNRWMGIFLNRCNESQVENNTCINNSKGGILLDNCTDSLIKLNKCSENSYQGGIRVFGSPFSQVIENTCENNFPREIMVVYSGYSNVSSNMVNGDDTGILILDSKNMTINDNHCSNNSDGIWIRNSENSIITDNFFFNSGIEILDDNIEDYQSYQLIANKVNGKDLMYSVNLVDFCISSADYGQIILVNCEKGDIKNQFIENTQIALALYFCKDISIQNSTCNSNTEGGIHLRDSNQVSIVNSTCSFNGLYGILLENASYNKLEYNHLEGNMLWGVILDSSSTNNSIHHNSFVSNNQYYGTSQAKDDGHNNQWYDEKKEEGNYWEDYSGVGSYSIDGLAAAEDPYPLSEPPVYRNNNVYYAFLSLIAIIPLIAYSYFKFRSKRKR